MTPLGKLSVSLVLSYRTVWSDNQPASHWWYPSSYAACSWAGVAMVALFCTHAAWAFSNVRV